MKKISTKMFALIVPVVVIALLLVATVSVGLSRTQLRGEMEDNIEASMNAVENNINFLLSEPETTTEGLALAISSDLEAGDDLMAYEKAIQDAMKDSDYIIAMGFFMDPDIWGGALTAASEEAPTEEATAEVAEVEATDVEATEAEPTEVEATEVEATEAEAAPAEATEAEATEAEAADVEAAPAEATEEAPAEEAAEAAPADLPWVNYYWVKDGETISYMDIGQDTDLRKTAWWIKLDETHGPAYTETYIDSQIGTLMCSYVVPIFDKNGRFVGALNTDLSMGKIQDFINDIVIGDTGNVRLFQTVTGQHLTGVDPELVLNEEETMFTDVTTGLDVVAQEVIDSDNYTGTVKGTEGTFLCYTSKFTTYDWILVGLVNENEITSVINHLMTTMFLISIGCIIVCVGVVTFIASGVSGPMIKVQAMADSMANGDFTMEPLKLRPGNKDEIARMTRALNKMLESNRKEMTDISDNSKIVNSNSATLQSAVRDLEQSFVEIQESITSISSAMMDNNATTEELAASIDEVQAAVGNLADKAKESEKMSAEIMNRAKKINKESTDNFDNAMALTKQYESELNASIENSKVVEEIGIMADAINEIASQINLLSLNASIEAARAGDAGRGFAVVATEIGNLATQTSTTVSNIQETIVKVKDAVTTLADNSGKIIKYINDSVTPDYKNFVDVSVQYEDDAVGIRELSEYVSTIAATLSHTMDEFTSAIQNIAEMSQTTTESAAAVLSNVDVVSENVENVDNISADQLKISQELDEVVARYKL